MKRRKIPPEHRAAALAAPGVTCGRCLVRFRFTDKSLPWRRCEVPRCQLVYCDRGRGTVNDGVVRMYCPPLTVTMRDGRFTKGDR